MFANVIVDISLEKLDRPFCYLIPSRLEDSVKVGSIVEVPFGNGSRVLKAYVIEITENANFPIEKIKEIRSVIKTENSGADRGGAVSEKSDNIVTSRLIELAYWMKTQYGSTMNHALKIVFPLKENVKKTEEKSIRLSIDKTMAFSMLEPYCV